MKELNIDSLKFLPGKQKIHDNSVLSIFTAKDGNYLYTASVDKQLKVWDTTERNVFKKSCRTDKNLINKKNTELNHIFNLKCMVITPDLRYIFTGSYDKTIKKWCANTHLLVRDFGEVHDDYVCS